MKVALVGSHGTGKTTTLHRILQMRDWTYISEATRYIMPILNYEDPYEFVEKYGIGVYECIVMSHWCILDPKFNKCRDQSIKITLMDRSPLDNLVYYYLLAKDTDKKYEDILTSIATHYVQFIDLFILFPVNVFEFEPDKMQRKQLQNEHDMKLRDLLQTMKVSTYQVKEITVDARAKEIIGVIDGYVQ